MVSFLLLLAALLFFLRCALERARLLKIFLLETTGLDRELGLLSSRVNHLVTCKLGRDGDVPFLLQRIDERIRRSLLISHSSRPTFLRVLLVLFSFCSFSDLEHRCFVAWISAARTQIY